MLHLDTMKILGFASNEFIPNHSATRKMDNKTQITINQDTQSHPCKERQRLDSSQEETLKHILREEYDPIYSIYGKASIQKTTLQHSNLTLAENKKRNKVSKTLEVITKPHFQNQHTKRQLFDTLINNRKKTNSYL